MATPHYKSTSNWILGLDAASGAFTTRSILDELKKMIEFSLYLSFFIVSCLLILPSVRAKRASSRADFTITSYRIFFTYNVVFMIIHIGISRTGNIPLTNIKDAPFVDLFSFIIALAYGYMMASLRKPDEPPKKYACIL
jgi:hypothetical protein